MQPVPTLCMGHKQTNHKLQKTAVKLNQTGHFRCYFTTDGAAEGFSIYCSSGIHTVFGCCHYGPVHVVQCKANLHVVYVLMASIKTARKISINHGVIRWKRNSDGTTGAENNSINPFCISQNKQ